MGDSLEYLKKWMVLYLKNKDIHTNSIKEISDEKNIVKIRYIDRDVILISQLLLDYNSFKELLSVKADLIVALFNTEENVRLLIENWKEFKQYRNLQFYFINPNSGEGRWVLKPYIHDTVSNQLSLKKGIMSMFTTVGEITESQIKLLDISDLD